jgi:hypothetical protein
MLNVLRPRILAICLTLLAIFAGSLVLAKDEPNANNQPNQEGQQAQPNQPDQPAEPQLNPQKPQPSEPLPTSDEQSQQKAQKDQQQNQVDKQQSTKYDEPTTSDQSNRTERATLRDNTAGMPRSANPPGEQQSGDYVVWRGASLGVNITGSNRGVVVTRVHEGTPAQQMGLRSGDRIVSLNGEPVRSADGFIASIRNKNPSDQIELAIIRDQNQQTIRGNLEPYSQARARNPEAVGNNDYRNYQEILNRGGPDSTLWSRDDARNSSGVIDGRLRTPTGPITPGGPGASDETLQASFEDSGDANRPRSGDVEARLARIEKQLDRISQDLEDLHNIIGPGRLKEDTSTGLDETRTRSQTQPRTNPAQPGTDIKQQSRQIHQNDRWNTENRFEQGDLPGARERAALEAARRQAEQTGARLQQQQRELRANSQQPPQPKTEQTPSDQPKTDQPTGDQPQNK